ncbi:protein arginine N-methyltransferase 2 isoform X5 [Girardinichthys multiradiatus]|uniref:protein arginine N-methyltransferase 2 isoform X5 n=1 Tax=Girardinichthys multiradiatus TaxID=208333 RepID=UPI001FAE31D3|nr:protein arginine N-methyltransferase 2 isoform X5 [Girardinichthys multiradiatus]
MQAEKEEEEASPEEYVALCDFTARGSEQLGFSTGDKLLVHAKPSADWWWAELQGVIGYAPASYLRQDAAEDEDEDPWQDDEYFGSYGTLRLHLEMLSDRSRTETYRQVIVSNSASLRNKVVMDLGCGTGIISLFCAQLAQPSVFEFMVESVLLARDRWLRDGGVMWPSSAALTLVPCQADSYYSEKMAFWERPYGLDFTPLQPLAQQEFFTKPKFSHLIDPKDCLSAPCDVICLNMYTVQVRDLEEMEGEFKFCVVKPGVFHGFTAWFTVQFESLEAGGATVELDTGPNSDPTHWKQTLFMLDKPIHVYGGDSIRGNIVLRRNPVWRRHMTVTLHWTINSSSDNCQVGTKSFPMWK